MSEEKKKPKEIKISVSILCADFAELGDEVKRCEDAGVDLFHVDVMDGHFVPNITIGPIIVEALRTQTKLPIEAHLMIEHPWMYIDQFVDAGADIISLHAECYGTRRIGSRDFGQFPKEVDAINTMKAKEDIIRVKQKGKKVHMVLNPGTPACFGPLLNDLEGVLIMSVNPGFAKQKFMPMVLPKIQEIRNEFEGDIVVDGGINDLTAPEAVKAGANVLATASYFFGAEKPKDVVRFIKGLS